MHLVRTTIRLRETLKKSAEHMALEENTSLQDVINSALESYLEQEGKKAAKKIVFKTHHLGTALDTLTRDDYYPNP